MYVCMYGCVRVQVARNTDGGGFFHVRNDSITPPESNETSPTDIKKIK